VLLPGPLDAAAKLFTRWVETSAEFIASGEAFQKANTYLLEIVIAEEVASVADHKEFHPSDILTERNTTPHTYRLADYTHHFFPSSSS
jgi:hypothetical protein